MVAMVAVMNCVIVSEYDLVLLTTVAVINYIIVSEFADGCNGSSDELRHCVGVC